MTPGKWRKSTRSQGGGNCVETRTGNHASALVELRDSKAPQLGSLAINRTEFTALLDSLKLHGTAVHRFSMDRCFAALNSPTETWLGRRCT